MNFKEAKQAVQLAFKIGRTPILHGLHGIGKSQLMKEVAKDLGYTLKDVRLGQMADSGDLIGLPEFHLDAKGNKVTTFIFPDWFPREENTIVFFDEFNRAGKDITQGVFETILDLSLKGVKFPKNCHVACAANPATDDYVVMDFNDAAMNDRLIHIKFNPTAEEFQSYMKTKYPNSAALQFLREDVKMLEDGGLQGFTLSFVKPSRRSWEAVMSLEELYEKGNVDENVFVEMVQGIVGEHATPAYNTFRKTHVTSIKAEDVLADYSKVRSQVLAVREKGRTDIAGNLVNDIIDILVTRQTANGSMELFEANNIIEVTKDLSPEQAYTLGIGIKDKCSTIAMEGVKGLPGGLMESDDFVNLFIKVKKLRDEGKLAIEEAAKKPKKSKKKE